MADSKSERLREARKKAGYGSASEAAKQFGWQEAAYRHHENGTRGFGADRARTYGRAFKVKASWLLGLDRSSELKEADQFESDQLLVTGSVAAGVWRESEQWPEDQRFILEGSQSPVPGAKRFGLLVEGRSMDVFYQPGTVLDCMSIFSGQAVAPETGDHVIVERKRPDGLTELTVKEYEIGDDGSYYLVPRSTSPQFRDRIAIGKTDHDHVGDDEIRVVAFVLGAYPPRTLELMKRMGLRTPVPN